MMPNSCQGFCCHAVALQRGFLLSRAEVLNTLIV